MRAKALLMAADGEANTRIAEEVGVTPVTVRTWRKRFSEDGLAKLGQVREGRGRKATIPAEKIAQIVQLTLMTSPHGAHALGMPHDGEEEWVSVRLRCNVSGRR